MKRIRDVLVVGTLVILGVGLTESSCLANNCVAQGVDSGLLCSQFTSPACKGKQMKKTTYRCSTGCGLKSNHEAGTFISRHHCTWIEGSPGSCNVALLAVPFADMECTVPGYQPGGFGTHTREGCRKAADLWCDNRPTKARHAPIQ
jgi:hypothetical protein